MIISASCFSLLIDNTAYNQISPVDESESEEFRHYFSQKPDPAGAPLLPDLLSYQTPAVLHIQLARLMPCTCLPQAGLRQKQRLQNLGFTIS